MKYEQKMKHRDFRAFYKKYFGYSLSIAKEIVKNTDLAQDIAQEVFCSLFQQRGNLKLKKNEKMLYGLVKRATVNKALDYQKYGHIRRELTAEEDFMEDNLVDEECNLEARILQMEEKEYAKLVLQRLRVANPMNYEILIKVKYLDISPDEVAREYGLTRNGVNNRIFRTKQWIEREMSRIYH